MDQEPIQTPPVSISTEPISSQPAPSPRSFNPFLILAIIVLLVLVGTGGVLLGKFLNTSQSSVQPTAATLPTQIPTPTSDITANWKTYNGKSFSFNFSPDFYYAEVGESSPHFYKSQAEADKQMSCLKKQLGTMDKPCSFGLFDISGYQILDIKSERLRDTASKTLNVNQIASFIDGIGREWTIVGPVYGLGGSLTDIELIQGDIVYRVGIHIWDDLINVETEKAGYEEKCLKFIKQILSTFKFNY